MIPSNRQMHGANSPGCTVLLTAHRKMSVYVVLHKRKFFTKPWMGLFFCKKLFYRGFGMKVSEIHFHCRRCAKASEWRLK